MGSSETKRDAPGIYQGDDIVRSYIERYKVLGGLFGFLSSNNSVKLFNKPIGFVQTHRYYSKKSTRHTGPKYKKEYKDQMKLSPFLKQALIGLILGEVYASRPKAHYNTRLVFDQSKEKHSDYLNYLYSLFEPFVGTEPTSTNRKPDKRNRF
jgi:hypothetical protein